MLEVQHNNLTKLQTHYNMKIGHLQHKQDCHMELAFLNTIVTQMVLELNADANPPHVFYGKHLVRHEDGKAVFAQIEIGRCHPPPPPPPNLPLGPPHAAEVIDVESDDPAPPCGVWSHPDAWVAPLNLPFEQPEGVDFRSMRGEVFKEWLLGPGMDLEEWKRYLSQYPVAVRDPSVTYTVEYKKSQKSGYMQMDRRAVQEVLRIFDTYPHRAQKVQLTPDRLYDVWFVDGWYGLQYNSHSKRWREMRVVPVAPDPNAVGATHGHGPQAGAHVGPATTVPARAGMLEPSSSSASRAAPRTPPNGPRQSTSEVTLKPAKDDDDSWGEWCGTGWGAGWDQKW